MMHETLKKLTDENLANVCGGQCIYYVFDEKEQKNKYYIPSEKGVLMTYNVTTVNKLRGDRQIQNCENCKEAEHYSWGVVNNFHLFLKSK